MFRSTQNHREPDASLALESHSWPCLSPPCCDCRPAARYAKQLPITTIHILPSCLPRFHRCLPTSGTDLTFYAYLWSISRAILNRTIQALHLASPVCFCTFSLQTRPPHSKARDAAVICICHIGYVKSIYQAHPNGAPAIHEMVPLRGSPSPYPSMAVSSSSRSRTFLLLVVTFYSSLAAGKNAPRARGSTLTTQRVLACCVIPITKVEKLTASPRFTDIANYP